MSTWSTRTTITGTPEEVIEVLTDPDTIRRWSPIDFRIEELDSDRLVAGTRARVSGCLAGRCPSFEVDVSAADAGRFALTASGPIQIEVEYEAFEAGPGEVEVWASLSVEGSGLRGRVLSQATSALLAAGALDKALMRIADEVGAPGSSRDLEFAA
jgi:hypothetical protein